MKGLIITMLLLSSSVVFSQKQTSNMPAPAKVKIDGKLDEWTGPFQINKPTKLSYIIANDQKNLYLAIQSSDSLFNARIISTGIDFMINQTGKKKEGPTVMFPVIDKMALLAQAQSSGPKMDPRSGKNMLSQIKEIKVVRFKDITEERISIYNEYGIKSAGAYYDKETLFYELAIPLKLLGISPDSKDEIAYNIKINGSQTAEQAMRVAGGGFAGGGGGFQGGGDRGGFAGGGDRGAGGDFNVNRTAGGNRTNGNTYYEASDFWINYTLAKPTN